MKFISKQQLQISVRYLMEEIICLCFWWKSSRMFYFLSLVNIDITCPCSIKMLPKHLIYKTLPAQWASSLSFQLIKPALVSFELTLPSLFNEPSPSASSSLLNPSCATSLLPEHKAYKTLQFLISFLPEHRAYKTLPAQWPSSLSVETTEHFLLNEPAPWASSLQNTACSMNQFTELPANKARPAQWASSLSIKLTKHSLLNEPDPWAPSLQNPPCSMSQVPERRA